MTKQEIITLLIKDYEEAIERCKAMKYEHIHDYLRDDDLCAGVCFAAKYRHNVEISEVEWVNKNADNTKSPFWYWAEIPMFLGNKKKIITSLQTRLSILKTELEIPE